MGDFARICQRVGLRLLGSRWTGLRPTSAQPAIGAEPLVEPGSAIEDVFRRVLGRSVRPDEREWACELWSVEPAGTALVGALIASSEHQTLVDGARFVPPGHFYSPLPSDRDIASVRRSQEPAGIDLRPEAQLDLLGQFASGYAELPFAEDPQPGLRFHYGNPNYSYSDAILLASMLRMLTPKRFIEVGSGDSSCALLDVNDHFLDAKTDITFVEPYPAYLNQLLGPEEAGRIRMLPCRLQDVDPAEFDRLESGDILFIDSTHVSKAGSDVNHVIFEILPRLSRGVYIHIHDVFSGFEYPDAWLHEGRAWNEQYILRAFLEFNSAFEVVLFGNWMVENYSEWFAEHMPLCLKNPGGAIWLRRK